MSRSSRLRTRTVGAERSRSSKRGKSEEELDTYGLVEENGGRPFQLIEGLPCSIELPQYASTLTHPLSVKDSAVLYSSMLSSRRTWISSEMFDMLWSKQYLSPSEKERLEQEGIDPESVDASAAREKMHKLCDCAMAGGPHAFSVRLFILKNDEIEKKWNDAIEQKRRNKADRKNRELEVKKKKQEERKQQQWIKKQEKEHGSSTAADSSRNSGSTDGAKKPVKRRSRKEDTTQQRSRSHTPRQRKSVPQSTEDQKMITNLNLMAQKNPELNSLMIVVAGGRASTDQVEEFKKYIEKARKMPVPPGWKPTANTSSSTPQKLKSGGSDSSLDRADSVAAPARAAKSLGASQVKSEETAQLSSETNSAGGTAEPRKKRKYTKRKNVDTPVELEDKSMQLTTFQQKYMHNADIVFEYVENPNKRFSLPKDAILEPLEDGESYLMSWILIHNRKELEKYKEKRKKALDKKAKPEETAEVSTEDSANKEEEDDYDIFEDPKAPDPLFTPMTVKFSNIHKKFQPIMTNSVNPAEKVRKRMSNIIERGTRLSGYNLWFQLDAYDDSDLAESLRCDLKDYESGFRSKRHRKQL
ncbi:SWR1-complex protein 3 [Lachancea thermotolerans]